MNYTKAMIDLVKEIRRRATSDEKPSIKLTNPDLFPELQGILADTNDAVMKALIKELFSLVGSPWSEPITDINENYPQSIFTSYRGQAKMKARSVEDKTEAEAKKKFSSQRIYRGQIVVD